MRPEPQSASGAREQHHAAHERRRKPGDAVPQQRGVFVAQGKVIRMYAHTARLVDQTSQTSSAPLGALRRAQRCTVLASALRGGMRCHTLQL